MQNDVTRYELPHIYDASGTIQFNTSTYHDYSIVCKTGYKEWKQWGANLFLASIMQIQNHMVSSQNKFVVHVE